MNRRQFLKLFILTIISAILIESSIESKLKIRRTAADLLGINNIRGSGNSSSSGIVDLSSNGRRTSGTNENSSSTILSGLGAIGQATNSGRSLSDILGTGVIRTATTGSNSVAIGNSSAASTSASSAANVVDVLEGNATSGTVAASGSETQNENNSAHELNQAASLTNIVGDGTAAATTEAEGATLIDQTGAAANSSSNTAGALVVNSGQGSLNTSTNGQTNLNFNGSTASSTTTGDSSLNILGGGVTGEVNTTNESNTVIDDTVAFEVEPSNLLNQEISYEPYSEETVELYPELIDEQGNVIPTIPANFWTDFGSDGTYDFIVLKAANANDRILTCDCEGNLKAVPYAQDLTNGQLWVPESIFENAWAFRNYYGGYLTLQTDNTLSCLSRMITDYQVFQAFFEKQTANNSDSYNLIMTDLNGNQIGVDSNNKVVSKKDWNNNRHVFTGHSA